MAALLRCCKQLDQQAPQPVCTGGGGTAADLLAGAHAPANQVKPPKAACSGLTPTPDASPFKRHADVAVAELLVNSVQVSAGRHPARFGILFCLQLCGGLFSPQCSRRESWRRRLRRCRRKHAALACRIGLPCRDACTALDQRLRPLRRKWGGGGASRPRHESLHRRTATHAVASHLRDHRARPGWLASD